MRLLSSGGKLPGGYHYLHVTKPSASSLAVPPAHQVGVLLVLLVGRHQCGFCFLIQDDIIVTGAAETGDYFSLRLDSDKRVETLTCLSLTPLPVSNLLCLYGKHEQLLGQLTSIYQQGLLTDLYRWEGNCSLLCQFDSVCLSAPHKSWILMLFSTLQRETSSVMMSYRRCFCALTA